MGDVKKPDWGAFLPRFNIPETFGAALSYEGQLHWFLKNWDEVAEYANDLEQPTIDVGKTEFPDTSNALLPSITNSGTDINAVLDFTYPVIRTRFADPLQWDFDTNYDVLTVVSDGQGNSYTSRQAVPAHTPLTDTDYWVLTGVYDASLQAIREDLASVKDGYARVYSTVADMQADTELLPGMVCHTLGFHSAGDDGAAWYIVGTGDANGMDLLDLAVNGTAALVTESDMMPEQLGAYGDGHRGSAAHDDSAVFRRMIALGIRIHLGTKAYWLASPLVDSSAAATVKIDIVGQDANYSRYASATAYNKGGSTIRTSVPLLDFDSSTIGITGCVRGVVFINMDEANTSISHTCPVFRGLLYSFIFSHCTTYGYTGFLVGYLREVCQIEFNKFQQLSTRFISGSIFDSNIVHNHIQGVNNNPQSPDGSIMLDVTSINSSLTFAYNFCDYWDYFMSTATASPFVSVGNKYGGAARWLYGYSGPACYIVSIGDLFTTFTSTDEHNCLFYISSPSQMHIELVNPIINSDTVATIFKLGGNIPTTRFPLFSIINPTLYGGGYYFAYDAIDLNGHTVNFDTQAWHIVDRIRSVNNGELPTPSFSTFKGERVVLYRGTARYALLNYYGGTLRWEDVKFSAIGE